MSEDELTLYHQPDFYQEMRGSIRTWVNEKGANYKFANYLLAAPDLFHLLCKLAVDEDVDVKEKALLAFAIVYFISPIDLVPEALTGPAGYVDDVVVAALALNLLVNVTPPEIVRRHWAGDEDILSLIQQILDVACEMVGSDTWAKIRKSLQKTESAVQAAES